MRVKRGTTTKLKHKRILARAKGMRAARGNHVKAAKEALLHAVTHAYNDRRLKKRTFRALWITRLSAAVRGEGLQYSRFIAGLKTANISLDRKVMSEIAIADKETFKAIIKKAQA
jgi:large subunit ribosomal protein L20